MNFNELTRARYSLRKFDPRPIEEEKLHLLLQAAQSAPTAHNNQPQYLLVCKSPDALARVDRCTTMHFGAPVVLVVCYDPAAAWVRTGIDGKKPRRNRRRHRHRPDHAAGGGPGPGQHLCGCV